MAQATTENGQLIFGESHINCNLFNIESIEEVSKKKLPYHCAHKKAKYINEDGELVIPENQMHISLNLLFLMHLIC